MTDLKGIEVINGFVTDWLQRNEFDLVAEMGTDYEICLGSNTLYYSPFYSEDTEQIYKEEIEKDFPQFAKHDLSITSLIAFFHEVGHAETEDEWDEEDWEGFEAWKQSDEVTNRSYFRHPIEWRATEWSCIYILENWEKVTKFWYDLGIMLEWFYEINQVELEEEENNICG